MEKELHTKDNPATLGESSRDRPGGDEGKRYGRFFVFVCRRLRWLRRCHKKCGRSNHRKTRGSQHLRLFACLSVFMNAGTGCFRIWLVKFACSDPRYSRIRCGHAAHAHRHASHPPNSKSATNAKRRSVNSEPSLRGANRRLTLLHGTFT